MRASSGISSPRSPNGCPLPSQCSSSARMPSAVSGSSPSSSAISAPRSQRASISERVTCPSSLIARSRAARARNEPSGATIRSDHTNAGKARDQFERFAVRLASWSSAPNSAAILAEFAEQPASFISSA